MYALALVDIRLSVHSDVSPRLHECLYWRRHYMCVCVHVLLHTRCTSIIAYTITCLRVHVFDKIYSLKKMESADFWHS